MNKIIFKLAIIMLISIVTFNITFGSYQVKGATETINTYIHKSGILPFYHLDRQNINQYNLILDYNDNVVYQKSENQKDIQETINKEQKVSNTTIIEILNNGYPNKVPKDLGCDNIEEAYMATQEAIYTIVDNKNIDNYIAYNESGRKVIKAMKDILNNALSADKIVTIDATEDKWKEEGEYLTKRYRINVLRQIYNSNIDIKEDGAKITDTNGLDKSTFADGDIIRILVPKDIDSFDIKFNGQLKEKGGHMCSDSNGKEYIYVQEDYYNMETVKNIKIKELLDIKIINRDNDTKEPIAGNEFELYKENELIKSNLITNNKGEILIEKLQMGIYRLKQKSVVDGYSKISSNIEVNLEGTDKLTTININNSKTKTEESINYNQEINITEENKEIEENNVTDILNIHTENVFKDIINTTNEINLYNSNEFINTTNIKNTKNIKRNKTYNNNIEKENEEEIILEDTQNYEMTREDFINYMDNVKLSNNVVPSLPLTGK